MKSFLYSANNNAGQTVTNRITAHSVAEARVTLEQKGFTSITFHTDEMAEKQLVSIQQELSEEPLPPLTPEQEKEGRQLGGMWAILWYGIKLEWRWWAVLGIWNTTTLLKGPPFDWLAWTGFVGGGLFIAAFVFFRLPAIAFDNLLEAAVWHNGDGVRRWTAVLRAFKSCTGVGVPEMELDCRIAVVMAREGNLPGAISLFSKHENTSLGKAHYYSRQGDLFSAARDYRGALECQGKAIQAAGSDPNFRLDYALGLIRRMRNAEGADLMLKDIAEENLSTLAKAFFFWIRGMIAIERNQFSEAEKHLRLSLQHNDTYRKNPLVQGMQGEVKTYLAIALAKVGRAPEAASLFRESAPLLMARKETELLERCRTAIGTK